MKKIFIEDIENTFYKEKYIKKSPIIPLIKKPFIKLKLEILSIDHISNLNIKQEENKEESELKSLKRKSIIYYNPNISIKLVHLKIDDNEKKIRINKISLSNQVSCLNPIWKEDFQFEELDSKDYILVIIYKHKNDEIVDNSNMNSLYNNDLDEKVQIGFVVLSIKELENYKISKDKYALEIVQSKDEVIDISKVDYDFIIKYSKSKSRTKENLADFQNPIVLFKVDYFHMIRLWKMSVTVHKILEREIDSKGRVIVDENRYSNDVNSKGNTIYQYSLLCKRNDGLTWTKEVSFKVIEKFRISIINDLPELKHIPFPKDPFWKSIPLFKNLIKKEKDDDLIEKKFTLDNFFENLMNIEEAYRIEQFIEFFTVVI